MSRDNDVSRFSVFSFLKMASALFLLTMAGCFSNGNDASYNLSGKVTLDGQPIPAGRIRFSPDGEQGNAGQTGFTEIKNGTYNTASSGSRSRGIEGGAYVVKINGYDGEPYTDEDGELFANGQPLFQEHSIKCELPKKSGTLDFELESKELKRFSRRTGKKQ